VEHPGRALGGAGVLPGRSGLVATVLGGLEADVMCLQETTPPDLAVVLDILGAEYVAHQGANGPELWTGWSTPEHPWEPNGTAIVWRSDTWSDVRTATVDLSDDGNVAVTIEARHVPSGRRVRVMSVHLDADHPELRRAQLPVALAAFAPEAGTVDVIAGDCNEDTIGTDLGAIAQTHGFADALTELSRYEPTHPYACPADDYAPIARLDHVLVRGADPVDGAVLDSDVWSVPEPGRRLAEHLRRTGSDHLPVVTSLRCRALVPETWQPGV
jgi:endonuclease/exonuclease/phosphatase family metal-dependent hydrolase